MAGGFRQRQPILTPVPLADFLPVLQVFYSEKRRIRSFELGTIYCTASIAAIFYRGCIDYPSEMTEVGNRDETKKLCKTFGSVVFYIENSHFRHVFATLNFGENTMANILVC